MQRDNSLKALGIITFLIWPFGTFLMALQHYRKPVAKWFFIMALTFLGYTIGIVGDLEVYHKNFFEVSRYSWSRVFKNIVTFSNADFYTLLMSKVVSGIGGDVKLYFAVLMFVFAYFYISIVQLIASKVPSHLVRHLILLLIGFATYHSLMSFISVRFYTATVIYIYAFLQVVLNNKRKYIFLAFLTPLVHVSFWITVPLFPIFFLFKDRFRVLGFLVLFTFIAGQTSIVSFLESTASTVEVDAISKKVDTYASDDGRERLEKRYEESGKNYNIKFKAMSLLKNVSFYYILSGLAILFFLRKKLVFKKVYLNYMAFCLLLWCLTNIMLNVSNGLRFLHLLCFSSLGLIVLVYADNYKRNKLLDRYIFIGTPILLLLNAMTLYAANTLFNTEFFVSNYFIEFLSTNINQPY